MPLRKVTVYRKSKFLLRGNMKTKYNYLYKKNHKKRQCYFRGFSRKFPCTNSRRWIKSIIFAVPFNKLMHLKTLKGGSSLHTTFRKVASYSWVVLRHSHSATDIIKARKWLLGQAGTSHILGLNCPKMQHDNFPCKNRDVTTVTMQHIIKKKN